MKENAEGIPISYNGMPSNSVTQVVENLSKSATYRAPFTLVMMSVPSKR